MHVGEISIVVKKLILLGELSRTVHASLQHSTELVNVEQATYLLMHDQLDEDEA